MNDWGLEGVSEGNAKLREVGGVGSDGIEPLLLFERRTKWGVSRKPANMVGHERETVSGAELLLAVLPTNRLLD